MSWSELSGAMAARTVLDKADTLVDVVASRMDGAMILASATVERGTLLDTERTVVCVNGIDAIDSASARRRLAVDGGT